MKQVLTLMVMLLASMANYSVQAFDRLVGADLSMVPAYEAAGDRWLDENGNAISDIVQYVQSKGWNAVRVRVFVDPSQDSGDPAVCQDLNYAVALGKRVKQAGMALLVDLHYSDTWSDPGQQRIPASWTDRTDEALATQLETYTREVMNAFVAAGAAPDYVQTGNEITYGQLWPTGHIWPGGGGQDGGSWGNFTAYLEQAIKACKEECPEAKIVIHTEMSKATNVTNFYSNLKSYPNISYDIIGLSYYPEYHGTVSALEGVIRSLEAAYSDKEIMIVETGHGIQWHIINGNDSGYELTEAGQKQFATDLITMLNNHPKVTGLYWWYPEDNGNGVKYKDDWITWWNAALFNHSTGKPYAAFYELKTFRGVESGMETLSAATIQTDKDAPMYNVAGQKVNSNYKGIVITNGKKKVVK